MGARKGNSLLLLPTWHKKGRVALLPLNAGEMPDLLLGVFCSYRNREKKVLFLLVSRGSCLYHVSEGPSSLPLDMNVSIFFVLFLDTTLSKERSRRHLHQAKMEVQGSHLASVREEPWLSLWYLAGVAQLFSNTFCLARLVSFS